MFASQDRHTWRVLNLYEAVRTDPKINKLAIGDFLFAEYTCGIGVEKLALWADTDYLVHVVTGHKTWRTSDGTWEATPGETLYFRKGAALVDQHFEVDFCLYMFFIPDQIVRATVKELVASLEKSPGKTAPARCAIRLETNVALRAFYQSMRVYFSGGEKPAEPLLRLKLKELIVSLLTSGRNSSLAAYWRALAEGTSPTLAEIMEANYRFNLSLEEYARLSRRSLSTFKRDFQSEFHETPGRWLLRKRLGHAAALLRGSTLPVTEVGLESGFEDISHFSRVFKTKFGTSPLAFRQRTAKSKD